MIVLGDKSRRIQNIISKRWRARYCLPANKLGLGLETVALNIADRVAWVILNRPEALNAWTRQLGEEMLTALDHAVGDPEVRAIVFTGAGRAFSSGADLKAAGD